MYYFTEQRPIVQQREAIITGFRAGIDGPKQPKPVVFSHSCFRRCPGASSDFGRFGRRSLDARCLQPLFRSLKL